MIEYEQPNITDTEVIDHEEFLDRIKKTLYYGSSKVRCTKISRPLADYAADVFSETHRGHSLSRLNFATVGNLSVTPCSLILAMIYLDRLNATDPTFVRRITPSELFIVSMMVSTKFYCGYDEDVYLSAWAEYGNMTPDQMKALELEFLDAMNWNAYVSKRDFFEKLKSVEKVLAKRQGLTRGWLTYTELINFLPSFAMAKQLIHYSTVLALSYTASVMTIAGAFLLASNLQLPGNLLYRGSTNLEASGNVSNRSTLTQQTRLDSILDSSGSADGTNTMEDCITDGGTLATTTSQLNATLKDCETAFASGQQNWQSTNQPLEATPFSPYRYRNIRFIFDPAGGNNVVQQVDFIHSEHETNESEREAGIKPTDPLQELNSIGSHNCSYDCFIPLIGSSKWCVEGENHDNYDGIFKHYKKTYDIFSSLLKFL
ncbi:protein CNPPD1 [Anopheles maculipalpis]|uniref:protein CNPPD1 n=1 Tax=Anopheles maculipalpis TaxID=1496333 RepID=UPI00215917DC|nr:protein CNPPD1 [Anopheles maculipalpis]